MIQESELIMVLLGSGVLFFLLANTPQLRRIPEYRLLIVSYAILFFGWVLTVAEGIFLGRLLNFMEHLCYAISSAMLALWIWKVCKSGKEPSDAVDRIF